ncbi:unnamed protein product [Schistosoma mattheei]|uniref:Uncharacterized protein n=1 Tax=Schistosoma mattheei TaxID=31246 RepID=A0A3P8F943_9TREM|nr:unnamed protein product [Schistosoma mattheei]
MLLVKIALTHCSSILNLLLLFINLFYNTYYTITALN